MHVLAALFVALMCIMWLRPCRELDAIMEATFLRRGLYSHHIFQDGGREWLPSTATSSLRPYMLAAVFVLACFNNRLAKPVVCCTWLMCCECATLS